MAVSFSLSVLWRGIREGEVEGFEPLVLLRRVNVSFFVSSFIFSFQVPFLSRFLTAFSLLLFSVFSWVFPGPAAAARSRVSFRPRPVPFPRAGALAEPWDPRGTGLRGFHRGECVIMVHGFLIRLPADGTAGRDAGLAPVALLPP